jgi:hypothetical protein
MKSWISIAAGMTLLLSGALVEHAAAQQHGSYDRFKDQTSYKAEVKLSELSKTSRGVSLSLSGVVDGDRAMTKSDNLAVSAIVTFNMSYDVRCAGTSFDMLADGKAVPLPTDMPAFNRHEYAISSFGRTMTLSEATTFANASKIEARVCGTEYALDDEQRVALRTLLNDAQAARPTGEKS